MTSERDVEVPTVPQPMGIVLEVQEHQEELENGPSIDSIHDRCDEEGLANNLSRRKCKLKKCTLFFLQHSSKYLLYTDLLIKVFFTLAI